MSTKTTTKGTISMDPIVCVIKGQSVGECVNCGKKINRGDDILIERKMIHRACFTCAICDNQLTAGDCFRDNSCENDFGVNYFCRKDVILPHDQKIELLEKHGKKRLH